MSTPRHVVAEPSDDEDVSFRIVTSIAELLGTDPQTLEQLHRTVDTDAQDALLTGVDENWTGPRVELRSNDCRIVVEGDGRVVAEQPSGDC